MSEARRKRKAREVRAQRAKLRKELGSKQAAYQAEHEASGLCRSCSDPRTQGVYCDRHAEEQRKRYMERHPGSRRYVCPVCKKEGHNRRTCTEVK